MRFIEVIRTKMARPQRLEAWFVGLGLGFIGVGVVAGVAFINQYQNLFYPNIYINNVALGGLTKAEALAKLQSQQAPLPESTVTLGVDGISISSSSAELGLQYNYERPLEQGILYAKQGSLPRRIHQILQLHQQPLHLEIPLEYDKVQLQKMIAELKALVDTPHTEAFAVLATSGNEESLTLDPGTGGRAIELEAATDKLQLVASLTDLELELPIASTGAVLSEDQLAPARERATKLVGNQVTFSHPDKTIVLSDQELIELLAFPSGVRQSELTKLLSNWQTQVTREPQDAVFEYDPETLKVTTFVPHLNGLELDTDQTALQLTEFLAQTENLDIEISQNTELPLTLAVKKPDQTLAKTNDLGIVERLGTGESEYDHSIPTRIHNVDVASSRINNLIVKPGQEFSFNQALGDVSAATGYKPAYVIKNGQTVLGDGGGVCQVSTTLFRAVLAAGLDVTRRLPHSYRVSYYELNAKPGIDATVYSGNVDLRFINDTDHHILIRSQADAKNLEMFIEIYGTSDGRKAEILDHKTWGHRPAPPAVYIPDSTLAPGQLKQVDWAASGIKASFLYKVTNQDGTIRQEKTFSSNYIPWSAKYLRGEAT